MEDTTKSFLVGMLGGFVAVGIIAGATYLYIDYRVNQAKQNATDVVKGLINANIQLRGQQ